MNNSEIQAKALAEYPIIDTDIAQKLSPQDHVSIMENVEAAILYALKLKEVCLTPK